MRGLQIPTCREMAELVTDFLENRLSVRSRLEARWHLLRCAACVRYFDQMRRTVRFLADRPAPPSVSEELEQRIIDRLKAKD